MYSYAENSGGVIATTSATTSETGTSKRDVTRTRAQNVPVTSYTVRRQSLSSASDTQSSGRVPIVSADPRSTCASGSATVDSENVPNAPLVTRPSQYIA